MVCQYVDKADGLSHLVVASIPKSQAIAMGYRMPCAALPTASTAIKGNAPGLAPLPPALTPSAKP